MISCTQMSTTFVNCRAADIRGEILLFKPLHFFGFPSELSTHSAFSMDPYFS